MAHLVVKHPGEWQENEKDREEKKKMGDKQSWDSVVEEKRF